MKEYIGIKRIKAEAESREGVDSTKMDGYKVVYENVQEKIGNDEKEGDECTTCF